MEQWEPVRKSNIIFPYLSKLSIKFTGKSIFLLMHELLIFCNIGIFTIDYNVDWQDHGVKMDRCRKT